MKASTIRTRAAAMATFAAIAALAAPIAVADPPNHQRHLPQAQSGLTHVPEIVSGLVSSPQGRPSPQPEVISGIASPGDHVTATFAAQPAQPSFDWGDAGIGAAVALAAAALASASALALRKRGRMKRLTALTGASL